MICSIVKPHIYQAYESLSRCPIEFSHPYDAVQLEGIGPKIADMLTQKMKVYCEDNGLPMPPAPNKGKHCTVAKSIHTHTHTLMDLSIYSEKKASTTYR